MRPQGNGFALTIATRTGVLRAAIVSTMLAVTASGNAQQTTPPPPPEGQFAYTLGSKLVIFNNEALKKVRELPPPCKRRFLVYTDCQFRPRNVSPRDAGKLLVYWIIPRGVDLSRLPSVGSPLAQLEIPPGSWAVVDLPAVPGCFSIVGNGGVLRLSSVRLGLGPIDGNPYEFRSPANRSSKTLIPIAAIPCERPFEYPMARD